MDGGNILKALVWKITGNSYKGVAFASRIGQIFGGIAILSGLLPLVLYGSLNNFWNLLIGFFLLQNAGNAAQFARVQEKLIGLTAGDAVTANSPIIFSHLSLREFADQHFMSADNWRKFLVIDEQGQLIGAIAVTDLQNIPTSAWVETTVKEIMQPMTQPTTVQSNRPLLEVVELLEKQQLSTLPVMGENGVLMGILEKTVIIQLIQQRSSFKAA